MAAIKRAKGINTPVSQIDLVPTLLELMEHQLPAHLEGRSLASSVKGHAKPAPSETVIEWNSTDGLTKIPEGIEQIMPNEEVEKAKPDPIRTIVSRDGRWKLSISPEVVKHELYDLHNDPFETENVFGVKEFRNVAVDLFNKLQNRMKETCDNITLPNIY